MKVKFAVVATMFLVLCVVGGCMKSTQKQSIEHNVAGVFIDSTMERNYEYYEERIRIFREKEKLVVEGITTFEDLKLIGLNPFADNVGYYEGMVGLNTVGFNFQQNVNSTAQMDTLIRHALQKYKVIVYSLRNIKKGSGYFNTASRVTKTEGSDVKFVVVLKDNVVISASEGGLKHLDVELTENFVGGGMYDFFRDTKLMLEVILYIFIVFSLQR